MRARLAIGLCACVTLAGCLPDLSPWEVHRGVALRDGGRMPDGTCTRTLEGNAITGSSAGCFFDERISGESGQLEHACESGSARVTFGEHTFVGAYEEGYVDVSLTTRYTYGSCDWITEQRIRGTLASGRLDYAYSEAPAPGQSGCSTACSGWASVDVR